MSATHPPNTPFMNGLRAGEIVMDEVLTQEEIKGMLEVWQIRLGLGDWIIAVNWSEEPPEVNGHACHMKVHRSNFYKRAAIDIGPTAISYSNMPDCIEKDVVANGIYSHRDYVEFSIVHELLHLSLRDLMRAAELVDHELHPSVRNVVGDVQQQAEEHYVESMAQALVRAWHKDHD
jgi:hypothetical protein